MDVLLESPKKSPLLGPSSQRLGSYRLAALKGLGWLADQLREDGSYGTDITDLASYYKHPWLYILWAAVTILLAGY